MGNHSGDTCGIGNDQSKLPDVGREHLRRESAWIGRVSKDKMWIRNVTVRWIK
jgi:hypothetical protein